MDKKRDNIIEDTLSTIESIFNNTSIEKHNRLVETLSQISFAGV